MKRWISPFGSTGRFWSGTRITAWFGRSWRSSSRRRTMTKPPARCSGAVRELLKRGQPLLAARCVREASGLRLPLPLTARERLRLAGALEIEGDTEDAAALLLALIAETPDAPEDEMARLKLGQLLRASDPARANAVLSDFLAKYPYSQWAGRAKEMQTML